MSKLFLALSTLFILWLPLSTSAQENFSSVDAFVKSILKGEDRLSDKAKGDLNGDGLEDWAGVIHRQQADSSPTYQLYVLLRLRQGGYHVAAKSMEEEIPGMGCCWLESFDIRGSSIYLQNNAKTASVMEAVTHQFKLYKGKWRLVGIKSFYTDLTPDAEETIDTDMNLLTGTVIEKKQKGENKPITRSRRKKFAIFLLKDFDFSTRFGNEEGDQGLNIGPNPSFKFESRLLDLSDNRKSGKGQGFAVVSKLKRRDILIVRITNLGRARSHAPTDNATMLRKS